MTAAEVAVESLIHDLRGALDDAAGDATADDLTFTAIRLEELADRTRRLAARKRGDVDDRPMMVCHVCDRWSTDLVSHRCRS